MAEPQSSSSTKFCKSCQIEKSRSEFYTLPHTSDGLNWLVLVEVGLRAVLGHRGEADELAVLRQAGLVVSRGERVGGVTAVGPGLGVLGEEFEKFREVGL